MISLLDCIDYMNTGEKDLAFVIEKLDEETNEPDESNQITCCFFQWYI